MRTKNRKSVDKGICKSCMIGEAVGFTINYSELNYQSDYSDLSILREAGL